MFFQALNSLFSFSGVAALAMRGQQQLREREREKKRIRIPFTNSDRKMCSLCSVNSRTTMTNDFNRSRVVRIVTSNFTFVAQKKANRLFFLSSPPLLFSQLLPIPQVKTRLEEFQPCFKVFMHGQGMHFLSTNCFVSQFRR